MADKSSFLGVGWGFPPTFDRNSGGVAMIADEDDIQSSLEILLTTELGERVMQPRYGCSLRRFQFEPVDTGLQAYLKEVVRTAVLYFEPRIVLENVRLVPQAEQGRLDIHVEYTIASTNVRSNFVYPFYQVEGSEVRP